MSPALPSHLASLSLSTIHPSWLHMHDGITSCPLNTKAWTSVGPDAQCVWLLFLESYSVKLALGVRVQMWLSRGVGIVPLLPPY